MPRESIPADVERYVKEVKEANPGYTEAQAWATAWSIYCKHKKPGDPKHCEMPASEYLKGRSAKEVPAIVRVASRYLSAQEGDEDLPPKQGL